MASQHVLHAFKDYYPPVRGGVEQHINDLVHQIAGFDFTILTSSRSRRLVVEDDAGVRVIRTPEYFRPVSTPVTPSWRRYLAELRFDLAHFHMPNPFGELALLGSFPEAPVIATYHADIVGRRLLLPFFYPFQQAFLRKARRIVVGSPRLVDTSRSLQGHRDKTVVIPYGTDPQKWAIRPEAADEMRERHRPPLVLFVGRISYYKGLDVLLRAMTGIEGTCLIVGDGPRRAELEAQSDSLGLQAKVVFCGQVPDEERAAYYHAADIFVLPSTSRAETFGIAMLEAMACGTPAISTELGTGTSWLNQNQVTGLVVEPGSASALAGAINELLKDPARRQQLGAAAAERARREFPQDKMLSALDSVYRSV